MIAESRPDFNHHVNGAMTTAQPTLASLRFQEVWNALPAAEKLPVILEDFTDPLRWFDEDVLPVLATFRREPLGQWSKIKQCFKNIGGNPRDLQGEVDALLLQAPLAPSPPLASAIVSYAGLQELTMPKREVYLDWLSERALVMLYGPRGVGKTMALLGLAVSLTTGQPFLKWPVYRPTGVLYVEGEMPVDELRDRAKLMAGNHEPIWLNFLPSELVYRRLDRDLTLVTAAARQEIEDVLATRPALRILILDNISCLFPGLNEDKKQDWEPVNAWLIRLRHRGITVILGHHDGKGGYQRGTSGREDALNTTIALSFPAGYRAEEGCHFTLRFEKSRGVKGETVEGLDIRFDETTGWSYQKLEANRTEQIKLMLADGMPPRLIAEELGVIPSYVYRLKRNLGF